MHYMLLRLFDTFDVDGDGFLSQQEIYAMKEASGRRSFGRVGVMSQHDLTIRIFSLELPEDLLRRPVCMCLCLCTWSG